jgi:hypothetical protein
MFEEFVMYKHADKILKIFLKSYVVGGIFLKDILADLAGIFLFPEEIQDLNPDGIYGIGLARYWVEK